MVTGSHIPDDRNGIKFNKQQGEILKGDEAEIRRQLVEINDSLFTELGFFSDRQVPQRSIDTSAEELYISRYLQFFNSNCLQNKKIGVYQHSAVGRDMILDILSRLGAEVFPLGRSDNFIPVDTEAIRPEDIKVAEKWAQEYGFYAIVSTDGDSDRPMIADEKGRWMPGDLSGILCAKYLQADSVCTPISSNSALERCGLFSKIKRTRIGSPYVIESMMELSKSNSGIVIGFEANGGFLIQSDINNKGNALKALPTRDAFIVLLSVLCLSIQENRNISGLYAALPQRFTSSNRLKNFPIQNSLRIIKGFSTGDFTDDKRMIEKSFGDLCGKLLSIDRTDGLRMYFENDDVIHIRPSGNAPELRCYNESNSKSRADYLNEKCLSRLNRLAK